MNYVNHDYIWRAPIKTNEAYIRYSIGFEMVFKFLTVAKMTQVILDFSVQSVYVQFTMSGSIPIP